MFDSINTGRQFFEIISSLCRPLQFNSFLSSHPLETQQGIPLATWRSYPEVNTESLDEVVASEHYNSFIKCAKAASRRQLLAHPFRSENWTPRDFAKHTYSQFETILNGH